MTKTTALLQALAAEGVTIPPAVTSTLALAENVATTENLRKLYSRTRVDLTSTADDVFEAIAVRKLLADLMSGTGNGAAAINDTVAELRDAALDALRDDFDGLLAQLHPAFDRAAEGVHAASKAGIEPGMDAGHVLRLRSLAASDAWRALPAHVQVPRADRPATARPGRRARGRSAVRHRV